MRLILKSASGVVFQGYGAYAYIVAKPEEETLNEYGFTAANIYNAGTLQPIRSMSCCVKKIPNGGCFLYIVGSAIDAFTSFDIRSFKCRDKPHESCGAPPSAGDIRCDYTTCSLYEYPTDEVSHLLNVQKLVWNSTTVPPSPKLITLSSNPGSLGVYIQYPDNYNIQDILYFTLLLKLYDPVAHTFTLVDFAFAAPDDINGSIVFRGLANGVSYYCFGSITNKYANEGPQIAAVGTPGGCTAVAAELQVV